jgi:hypothetical protein
VAIEPIQQPLGLADGEAGVTRELNQGKRLEDRSVVHPTPPGTSRRADDSSPLVKAEGRRLHAGPSGYVTDEELLN